VPAHTLKSDDDEESEAYEAAFPKKEKRWQEGQLLQFCQSCGMPLTEALLGTKPTGAGTTTIASIITKTALSPAIPRWGDLCAVRRAINEHTGRNLARIRSRGGTAVPPPAGSVAPRPSSPQPPPGGGLQLLTVDAAPPLGCGLASDGFVAVSY